MKKDNLINFLLGMMVALGLFVITSFAIEYDNYLNLFLLTMAGLFLGLPIGLYLGNRNDD